MKTVEGKFKNKRKHQHIHHFPPLKTKREFQHGFLQIKGACLMRPTLIWVMQLYYVQLDFPSPSHTITAVRSALPITHNRRIWKHLATPRHQKHLRVSAAWQRCHDTGGLTWISAARFSTRVTSLTVFTVLFRRRVSHHLPFAIASAPKYVERRVLEAGERFQYMLCVVS